MDSILSRTSLTLSPNTLSRVDTEKSKELNDSTCSFRLSKYLSCISTSKNKPSDSILKGLALLSTSFDRILHQNMLDCVDAIKSRECEVLRCGIFAQTLQSFIKRKAKESTAEALERLQQYQSTEKDCHDYAKDHEAYKHNEAMLSLETNISSIMGSTRQYPVLCDNCRKVVNPRPTVSKTLTLLTTTPLEYIHKQPQTIICSLPSSQTVVTKKLRHLFPDSLFTAINDQIDKHALFTQSATPSDALHSPKSVQLPPQLPFSTPCLPMHTLEQPCTIQQQLMESHCNDQTFLNIISKIEKSFIDRLATDESKLIASHVHEQSDTLPKPPTPQIQESRVIYSSKDDKQVFMKSIDMNRNLQVRTLPLIPSPPKYERVGVHQRFTDSEIRRHITGFKSQSKPEKWLELAKVEKEENVGRPVRERSEGKPTFFETAYYFN